MNGLNIKNSPSLNGLTRSDGTSLLVNPFKPVNNATGRVILTSDDTGSFFFTSQGEDSVILNTPFTTIQEDGVDLLSTNMDFQANEINTTKLNATNINTNRLIVGGTEFNPGTGGVNPSWGEWQFALHPDGHLNVMRGNIASYRFLADPINIFSRVCQFNLTQKGSWGIRRTPN